MSKQNLSQVRIIGGQWRGRKINFPALEEVRPTPDRVRETLFNWLAPYIVDANCLDLFAGSGALSFEALSRGAKYVVMADKSPVVVQQLRANSLALQANNIAIYETNVPQGLALSSEEPFDIVFLDPPFHQSLLKECAQWLEEKKLIHAQTFIYIEVERELKTLPIPAHWRILKSGKTQQIQYHLMQPTLP